MIAILGTGLLGSGFTRALRQSGHDVRVWNRTVDKARPLAEIGAVVVESAADAVRGAERIHVVVSDDAAVDAVLDAARLEAGALVIDHSTTSTAGARERTSMWRARGVTYLHAPVFMGPQNAAESTGLMLVSGDRTIVGGISPMLRPMTGKLVDLGERVDAAAAFKLLGNLFLMALAAGFMDMIALGRSMGLSPSEVGSLFDHFNPGAQVPARFKRMTDAAYEQPSWELAMARKDARLMQHEMGSHALEMLPAVVARMDAAIVAGDSHLDWTVIARDLVQG
ncbi:MAG: NAD(P)-dependent oxidoreductase [Kofleriaceae bacterium]